jgi:LysR family tcuABC transcriptional regulator
MQAMRERYPDVRLHMVESLSVGGAHKPLPRKLKLADLKDYPLILPSGSHGLRSTLDAALSRSRLRRLLPQEIDSLAMLMDAVRSGLGYTIQPGAALARFEDAAEAFQSAEIADVELRRYNCLCSLSEDELTPAALAVRLVLADCARTLVKTGRWNGAILCHHKK